MAEIADSALPVLPFRVNWKNGIAERLEWKTNILADFKGNEQRQAARLTPRREFEVTISLWGEDRQFWDLWLHRMVGTECMIPLWHDSVRATQAVTQGQRTIRLDTRGLEWEIGSYGLLRGLTAISSERFQVAEVHDDRLVAVAPIGAQWPKGTRVEPLRRGRMTDQTDVSIKNDRVSEATATFQLTTGQPFSTGVDDMDQYAGMPVVTRQPNRSESINMQYLWSSAEADNEIGRRYRKSDTGRAMVHQKHAWFLRGRAAKRDFRSMMYRLRGAQVPFWLPTFNSDMTPSRNTAGTSLYVKAFGFAYTGGVTSGRDRICVRLRDGTCLYRRITGTAVSGNLSEERLVLDAALPPLRPDQIALVSWMDAARFENDRIEFNHVNAADGVSTVVGMLQTFRNDRQAPAILSAPILQDVMSETPCGEDVSEIPDPCRYVPFDGVYLLIEFTTPNACNPNHTGNRLFYVHEIQPNGPGGVIVGGFEDNFGGVEVYTRELYENTVPGNPRLQGQLLRRYTSYTFNHCKMEYFFPGATFNGVIVFPSAFYCSPVGKDHGTGLVTYVYANGSPVNLGEQYIAGNSGAQWGFQ